jgi:DNA-directed RNA polymerase specialized sigma24 family protein
VGMPLEEVARTLDIPSGTARSRLYRALRSMRASIDSDTRPPSGGSTAMNEFSARQGMS